MTTPTPFKAETRQILDILIHALYTEREIFLRELISNASDALTRLDFEMLTNREVLDPDAEPAIWVQVDTEQKTITIRDTGLGMTEAELHENLGTIAHSGARAFLKAAKEGAPEGAHLADVIGQFGVGFYSVFMVASKVEVRSRSFRPDAKAALWTCDGGDTYAVEPCEKDKRGTEIIIFLKEDAHEFADEHRLREIIKKHSDFVPFPIYLGEENSQANQRTALWRQSPREVEKEKYQEFYRQMTLEFEEPLTYTHIAADAPVQVYAVLFAPAKFERGMFALRKEDGLKLYSRKVLIQDYCKDLLPEYLGFIHGVVDTEDLPLNVSRESFQANAVMARLKKLVTNKALDMFKKLSTDEPDVYGNFWHSFGRTIKQGIAIEQNPTDAEALYPLLRFHTTNDIENWSSLDDYVSRMPEGQTTIYYILGDDERSARYSPHLDVVKQHGYEVLFLTDPIDPFMLVRMKEYQGKPLQNVAQADLKLPEKAGETETKTEDQPGIPVEDWAGLVDRFKKQLGERVVDVRMTNRLSGSPARLVDPDGSPNQEMQRVYRMLKEDFEIPKKVLELNPRHAILLKLHALNETDERSEMTIEQLFENALLIEGLHQDPAGMIGRIQKLMEKALD